MNEQTITMQKIYSNAWYKHGQGIQDFKRNESGVISKGFLAVYFKEK